MWAEGCGLSLRQLLVDGKSNEITAVPKLLRHLDVKGAAVSLDAMGCQKKIAQEIRFAGGDYLLALKASHYLTSHASDAKRLGEPCGGTGASRTAAASAKATRRRTWRLLRKLALNLLRHDRTVKDTVRGKRIRAALCEDTLERLMRCRDERPTLNRPPETGAEEGIRGCLNCPPPIQVSLRKDCSCRRVGAGYRHV